VAGLLLVLGAGLVTLAAWPSLSGLLYGWTGEEQALPQLGGAIQLAFQLARPPLDLAPEVPVAHAGMNPFGVNTFLNQEVEPAKRERAMRMIHEAGFRWIRQEFPWQDIEIHGKGDFIDRRNEPFRSAWEKYDHIVSLAEKYGIEIIARLSTPPAWSRAQGDAAGTFAPPDDYNDFGDFVETVVRRYQGRVRYYQIWNEPNIYPEWGKRPVDATQYTELLKVAYKRAKAVDPDVVIIAAPLAATIELDRYPHGFSDALFLQQMYDAGARDYFDILSVQDYGLWSGPTDRRMQPRVLNYSRPLYIRDIMVKNGDAGKAIWLSEMNWNAVPPGFPDSRFGRVDEAQQARYAVEAYRRAQEEWPWMGVVAFWFFKQADDHERNSNAQYYFRMVEPDFTPLPVYGAIKAYANSQPIMYFGYHQEDHWAVSYGGPGDKPGESTGSPWRTIRDRQAILGAYRRADVEGAWVSFTFMGSDLSLVVGKVPGGGTLEVTIDAAPPVRVSLASDGATRFGVVVPVAHALPVTQHRVRIVNVRDERGMVGQAIIDGFLVRNAPAYPVWPLLAVLVALVLIAGIGYTVSKGMRPG
jgi:hypothetical protein